MMSSNPVVAAKRHTDPYAYKPLTTRSRQTVQQRSSSSQNLSSTQQSQSVTSGREYSRASSAGSIRTNASVRTNATNRSTTSTRSLSKEQVRDKMQRPPDIPTCRGGNINVYRCSAEYLEDFWAKQKAENDARRAAIIKSQAEHQRQLEAEAARNPAPSTRTKPVLSASVVSRTAALKPPPRTSDTTLNKSSASARPTSASSRPTIDAAPRKTRTSSAVVQPSMSVSPSKIVAGARSTMIMDSKLIGSAPRSASATKKVSIQSTSTGAPVSRTSSQTRASSTLATDRKASASPAPRPSTLKTSTPNKSGAPVAVTPNRASSKTTRPSINATGLESKASTSIPARSSSKGPVGKSVAKPLPSKKVASSKITVTKPASEIEPPAPGDALNVHDNTSVTAATHNDAAKADIVGEPHPRLEDILESEVSNKPETTAVEAPEPNDSENWLS